MIQDIAIEAFERLTDSFVGFLALNALIISLAAGAIAYGPVRWSCLASGEKMQIETEWSMWTGCMNRVHGQWLPWHEVVPVERNGRIVFEPKPYVRLAPPLKRE